MACSIAASSSSKSAVSGTPTKRTFCSAADIWYITKPGSGAMMTAPGTAQAMVNIVISSSEPLPSVSAQSSGMPACLASAARRSSVHSAG